GCRVVLAQIHKALGDLDAAEREARSAISLPGASPGAHVEAQGTLAMVLLAKGSPEEAREVSTAAIEMLEKIGQIDQGESLARLVDIDTRRATGGDVEAREAALRAQQRVMDRAATIEDAAWRERFLAIRENEATLRVARDLGVE